MRLVNLIYILLFLFFFMTRGLFSIKVEEVTKCKRQNCNRNDAHSTHSGFRGFRDCRLSNVIIHINCFLIHFAYTFQSFPSHFTQSTIFWVNLLLDFLDTHTHLHGVHYPTHHLHLHLNRTNVSHFIIWVFSDFTSNLNFASGSFATPPKV